MRLLSLLFGFILVSMIAVTTWASLEESVVAGFWNVTAYRWGWATLADAYFAFITFLVWVFYKERGALARVLWTIAVLLFGNIAMAIYVLRQIRKLPPGAPVSALFHNTEGKA